jgi:hypothetical protein
MDGFRKKTGSRTEGEKLKKLAEKFVKYFGGTFQCDVGHKVRMPLRTYSCLLKYILNLIFFKQQTFHSISFFVYYQQFFLVSARL